MHFSGRIVGWHHCPFGKHEEDVEELAVQAVRGALADAGVAAAEVDAIYVGQFNEGFSPQGFPASLALQADDELRFKPTTRVENACATGSAAVHQGLQAIAAGAAETVLVVGFEKMSDVAGREVGEILLRASYVKEEAEIPGGFAGVFGRIASMYFERFGDQTEALARIATKGHRNGAKNPLAHFRKELPYEFSLEPSDKNPRVAGPLKRTDCSPVSDGAAALILQSPQAAAGKPRQVGFRAAVHVQDFLPMSRRDIILFEGCREAWGQAHAEAGTTIADLSLVETHDCFTIAELIEMEAMGLAAPGQAGALIAEGQTEIGGRLPINPSGGLKAKGHPIGATGVSMHIMAAMQLCGDAAALQVENAKLAGVFNMGGAAVANYASILERVN
jgi:acetyl-CoA C-acetyltransferase